MRDLSILVSEQGEKVDSIEANVERAQLHVEAGLRNVKKAAKYKAAMRYPLAGFPCPYLAIKMSIFEL